MVHLFAPWDAPGVYKKELRKELILYGAPD